MIIYICLQTFKRDTYENSFFAVMIITRFWDKSFLLRSLSFDVYTGKLYSDSFRIYITIFLIYMHTYIWYFSLYSPICIVYTYIASHHTSRRKKIDFLDPKGWQYIWPQLVTVCLSCLWETRSPWSVSPNLPKANDLKYRQLVRHSQVGETPPFQKTNNIL